VTRGGAPAPDLRFLHDTPYEVAMPGEHAETSRVVAIELSRRESP
jgi:hypothetical protein